MNYDGPHSEEIAERLNERLRHAVGLPEADIDSIGVLIDAGEWKVALELLCTQLYEYDVKVSGGERRQLEALGAELNVAVRYLLADPWSEPNTKP